MAAYTPAVMADVKERLIALLNANPGVWSSSVSGDVGAFPSDDEITAAVLEADSIVCVDGYFQSVNDAMANHFGVTSGPLGNADNIPFHKGTLNKVELAKSVNSLSQASITVGTDLITCPAAHGLTTGDIVTWKLISGALPTTSPVFVEGTNYYAVVINSLTLKLARTLADALAATPVVADITVAPTGQYLLIGWQIGVEARNIDDVTNMVAVGESYINTTGAMDFLYKEDSGVIYTPATYARVTYPEYISNGTTLQANQNETTLLIMTAAAILTKNASPALFEYYQGLSQAGLQQIVNDGAYTAQHTEEANP
jgi:hypothetical protein